MSTEMIVIVVLVLILLLALYVKNTYNSFVKLKGRIEDQWSQISVQLKRRFDLIPNLVETVKGICKHESDTFKGVVEARNRFGVAKDKNSTMEASDMLTEAIGKVFALAESYPELKANENFSKLQDQLGETEEKIAVSRQIFNDVVLTYNNKVKMFPSMLIAKMFGFKPETYFEIKEAERENVKVEF